MHHHRTRNGIKAEMANQLRADGVARNLEKGQSRFGEPGGIELSGAECAIRKSVLRKCKGTGMIGAENGRQG